jgi:hypothetical protein
VFDTTPGHAAKRNLRLYGRSESRIGSVVSAMRGLYGYAIDREQVEFNPADALVMPRPDEPVRVGHCRDSLEAASGTSTPPRAASVTGVSTPMRAERAAVARLRSALLSGT